MKVVGNIIGIAMMNFSHVYTWHKLERKKINYRNYKLYIVLFISIIFLMASVSVVDKFMKIACTTTISILLNYYLMRQSIKRTVLIVIITQIITMSAETVLMFVLAMLGADIGRVTSDIFGSFAVNTSVAIIVILVNMFMKIIPRIYQWIVKGTEKISSQCFIAISFIAILISNVLAMTVYYRIDFKYLLVFNTLVTIVYFIIIIHSLYNRNSYLKVFDKYNTTLSSLKEYEDILNQYRVSNHENKNELMTIRQMVKNKEKTVIEYIDKIVENKLRDNEELMGLSMVIPEGGLRGLIYSKMLIMKEKKIEFEISVDKAIKTVELIKMKEGLLLDICKIVGVFLDNAIEEVEKLEERFVDLEMSLENRNLCISITNNYKGKINIEEMEEQGYTTKGEGHGYGLYLVRKIVEENTLLKNEKEITANGFTQRLIVDMSKVR